jgi:acyl-CoA reductase-like NAD-dependent aldehyde dehydrogenase
MATSQTTLSPHTQQPLVTRTYPSPAELDAAIAAAADAQKAWARVPLEERIAVGRRFIVRPSLPTVNCAD